MTNNQLKALIERIEHLEAEKATIATDIKDVYAEAKGTGFDPKIVKKVIAIRKRTDFEITEEQALIDIYLGSLGMLVGTPFKEAVARSVIASMKTETDQ
jgi:uncharacterized protein (UPF0335 family)